MEDPSLFTNEKESSSKAKRKVVVWKVKNKEKTVNKRASAPNGFAVNNLFPSLSRRSSKKPPVNPTPNAP